jgi:hypothetical protein
VTTVLIVWLIFGIAAALLAHERNGQAAGGFMLGVLLGPIGLLIVAAVARPQPETLPPLKTPNTRPCPSCAAAIPALARSCQFCRAHTGFPMAPRATATPTPPASSSASKPASGGATAPTTSPDVGARLRELAELHTAGLVTDKEFDTKRAALVAQL